MKFSVGTNRYLFILNGALRTDQRNGSAHSLEKIIILVRFADRATGEGLLAVTSKTSWLLSQKEKITLSTIVNDQLLEKDMARCALPSTNH